MKSKIETNQYNFTVEGETEKRYLEWLQHQINSQNNLKHKVSIVCKVEQNPIKYIKNTTSLSTPIVTHLCDYEDNQDGSIRFKNVLDQLNEANKSKPIFKLGYSNYTFELWILLHKVDCYCCVTHRKKYLPLINNAYGVSFDSLEEYKQEKNFNKILAQLTIENVKEAICRSENLITMKEKNNIQVKKYNGFKYYEDNPSLSVWEPIKKILYDCGLLSPVKK